MPKLPHKALLFILPVFVAIVFSMMIQATLLSNQELYARWLSSFGPLFIVVYIAVQVTTIVVAPLGGFFIQLGLLAILPPLQALLLIYAVTTPAFFINFFIARRYGRPIVERLVGNHGIQQIDTYSYTSGTFLLLTIKLFQSSIFDYASYAAGLTSLPFKTFALINILGGIPGITIAYGIFALADNFTTAVIALLLTSYGFFGASLLIIKLRQKT